VVAAAVVEVAGVAVKMAFWAVASVFVALPTPTTTTTTTLAPLPKGPDLRPCRRDSLTSELVHVAFVKVFVLVVVVVVVV
jgi:hypothetical protein